jgi:hypothetical protein
MRVPASLVVIGFPRSADDRSPAEGCRSSEQHSGTTKELFQRIGSGRREWRQLMRWRCRLPRRGKIAQCAAISALLRRNGTPPQPFPSGGAMIHEGQVRSSVCGRSSVEDCERRSLAAGRLVLVMNHAKPAWLGGAAHMPCKLKVAVQSVEGRAVTQVVQYPGRAVPRSSLEEFRPGKESSRRVSSSS